MEEKTKVNKNKPKDSQDRNSRMNIVKNLLDKGKKNGVLTYQEILYHNTPHLLSNKLN